ncbi:MAG: hypothetical protein WC830_18665 [Burkholderiales bacterium]
MFSMDVPYVPPQEAPIVLAQAAAPASGVIPQPDYILNTCTETTSTGDPRSAWRGVDPAGMLAIYLQNHANRTIDMEMLAAIKTTLLQGTTHGKIFAEVDNTGLTSYHYDPTPNYEGDDRAVFMAEFEGKVYKIVVEIKVLFVIDQNSSQCNEPTLMTNANTKGARLNYFFEKGQPQGDERFYMKIEQMTGRD